MKITPIEDSAEYGGGAHGVRVANDSRTSNKRNEITPPKAPRFYQSKPHLRQSHDIPPAKSSHINRGMWASSGSGGRADWPMSLFGQSRRFDGVRVTSALPSNSDIARCIRHVSKVPKHKVAALQPAAREQEPRGR